jgi:hypothetical protein
MAPHADRSEIRASGCSTRACQAGGRAWRGPEQCPGVGDPEMAAGHPGRGAPAPWVARAAEVRNSSHTTLGVLAPRWATEWGASLARNRGIVEERLGHGLRDGVVSTNYAQGLCDKVTS